MMIYPLISGKQTSAAQIYKYFGQILKNISTNILDILDKSKTKFQKIFRIFWTNPNQATWAAMMIYPPISGKQTSAAQIYKSWEDHPPENKTT